MPTEAQLAIELLKQLVAIESVNPTLVPGARGEAEAAQFLCGWLRERGIAAELHEASPQPGLSRPNVVAMLGPPPARDASGKPRAGLALVGHIDTVGAGDMPEAFTPRERDAQLYGRGALDIKCGVAAMCAAAIEVASAAGGRLRKPLLLAAVVDEECNSIGTQALVREYSAEAAVVMEPTDLKVCVAHKGFAWFRVTTQGRAAHGSLPGEGRDAIRMMGRVLERLDALDNKLARQPPHPLLGCASVHASLISGGQELSSYPAECRMELERRTLPGETDTALEAEIRALLGELRASDAEFRATAQFLGSRLAYEIAPKAPIAAVAAEAAKRVLGAAEFCGMSFWTDTALLGAAGIPGVVYGPRGRGLHGAEEYVELDSVAACAEVLREVVFAWCR